MTDISGNFGVNPHSYGKEIKKEKNCSCEKCNQEKSPVVESETDLDKSPQALSGRAMVKQVSAKQDKYQFKPELVEEDVQTFMVLADFTNALAKGYKQNGLSDDEAINKALEAMEALQAGAAV